MPLTPDQEAHIRQSIEAAWVELSPDICAATDPPEKYEVCRQCFFAGVLWAAAGAKVAAFKSGVVGAESKRWVDRIEAELTAFGKTLTG